MTVLRGDPILLHSEPVVLRGFSADEIDAALTNVASAELAAGDAAAVQRKRERLERSGTRTPWELWFAIEERGRLVGDVQGRCSELALPPGVWELGIEIWETADRGRGIGRLTCALLTSHLFEEEGAIRVQASTDVDNAPMRRTLERLGFGLEGVLRGFMPRSGSDPRDYAMYAMTKPDWTTKRTGWTPTS